MLFRTLDYQGLVSQLIIEAIPETMDHKKTVFAELEPFVTKLYYCIHTSALSISEMATAFRHLNDLLVCIF